MKKIKYSGIAKFFVTVLLTCSIVCFALMTLFSIAYSELGSAAKNKNDVYRKITKNYANAIFTELSYNLSDAEKNIDKILKDTRLNVAVFHSGSRYLDTVRGNELNNKDYYLYGSPEEVGEFSYYFWGVESGCYHYNLDSVLGAITNDNEFYQAMDSGSEYGYYNLIASVSDGEYDDLYKEADKWLEIYDKVGKNALLFQVISLIIMIASASYLVMAAGHRKNDDIIHLRFVDKVPFGVYSTIFALIEMSTLFMFEVVLSSLFIDIAQVIVYLLEIGLVSTFAFIAYIGTIITRIKAKKFWRYTLVYYLWIPIRKIKTYAQENTTLFWRMTIYMAIGAIVFLLSGLAFLIMSIDSSSLAPWGLWMFGVMAVVAVGVYFIVFQMRKIQDGVERIANGDVENPIDTTQLIWEFKKHADNINTIGRGIDVAVQEKMKSERFKTELITNVSHDIKTPLTSIINYVDLMKKEDITDPTLLEYMDVLDRQSARLKKLIEDLMEASKASTGNLEVNLEKCDISVMLGQTVGEFEEKMQANGLIPVVSCPDNSLTVMVDGRHLWRIFDNLLNNICKYAQSGTRVYIDIEQNGQNVEIVFKNISSTPLNISSDELMERFVRGDSSRNSEGNGLGLAIAKSLTELMNGELILEVDGDLFKVTLIFQADKKM